MLTGVSDVDLAVRAMKLGAFDYLTKPVDDDHLLQVIESAIEHRALRETIDQLPTRLKSEGPGASRPRSRGSRRRTRR